MASSDAVFPVLPGLDVQVRRDLVSAVKRQTTDSGKVIRCRRHTPQIRYTLRFNFLRQGGAFNEYATLWTFVSDHDADSFLYTDTYDSVQRRVEFDMGELDTAQIVNTIWEAQTLRLITVL